MTEPSPLFLFADSQLLFGAGGPPPLRSVAERGVRSAAYIGAANDDEPAYYSIFEAGMDLIGISDRRMVAAPYDDARDALRAADLIVIAGGDAGRGWRAMCDGGLNKMIAERYVNGATLVGVSAGAVLLGARAWWDEDVTGDAFDPLAIVPFIIDTHDEAHEWKRLRTLLARSDPPTFALGIPSGGGIVYHPDRTIEPLRRAVTELVLGVTGMAERLLVAAPDRGSILGTGSYRVPPL